MGVDGGHLVRRGMVGAAVVDPRQQGLGLAELRFELLAELRQGNDLVGDEPLQNILVSRYLVQGPVRLDSDVILTFNWGQT